MLLNLCNIIHIWEWFVQTVIISIESIDLVPAEKGNDGRLFTYTENSRGPNTDPCGTPDVTDRLGDDMFFVTTHCVCECR